MTDKLKREKINLMLTADERKQILNKSKRYGFGNKISDYAREACLNERFYIEEVHGKKEICESANKYAITVREYGNKLDILIKKPTLSTYDCEMIKKQSKEIIEITNNFINQIIKLLSINSIPKFQKRMRLIEKYEVSNKFIDKVIKNSFVLAVPSSLTSKNINDGTIAIFLDDYRNHRIEKVEDNILINYDTIKILIDMQRELALQRECYIFLKYDGEMIWIYLANYYKSEEEAKNKIDTTQNIELYNCKKKEG